MTVFSLTSLKIQDLRMQIVIVSFSFFELAVKLINFVLVE